MRHRLLTPVLAFASLTATGCAAAPRDLTPSQAAAIRDSVRAALAQFGRLAAAAQWDSLVGLYSADSDFRWIEDGRRFGAAAMRQGLSGVPAGVRVETRYDSTEVVALAPGLGVLTTYYDTRFVGGATPVHFAGAISMVWVHEPGGWRIRAGHSSSPPSPGQR